ncbi:hypothetical protein [Pedobacter sp. SYSU D00535]|uniref:hypothetical protein n=1 Tax=Pedobacter sp. SYSU D00535 TaxID=2810308 RepID=UPI001A970769|nr:hypothetical protein [Pedobacter sp. SYSU D00535]
MTGVASTYGTERWDNYREYKTESTPSIKTRISELSFVGEIQGISYIRMTLTEVQQKTTFSSRAILKYKGSYYEAVSGKTFALVGSFDTDKRSWSFKCFDSQNVNVSSFIGKQGVDGTIKGVWKQKKASFPFYLKLQE